MELQNNSDAPTSTLNCSTFGDAHLDINGAPSLQHSKTITNEKQVIAQSDSLLSILTEQVRLRRLHRDNLFATLKYLPPLTKEQIDYLLNACITMEYTI